MTKITFQNIQTIGHVIHETDQYRQFHYPEMLIRYDSNFIDFKSMPSLTTFMETEKYLRDFHLQHGQHHVKFTFPENEKLSEELRNYFCKLNYDVGFLELYAIQPSQFPSIADNPDIQVYQVRGNHVQEFLALRYRQDLQFGKEFADQRVNLTRRQLEDPAIIQLIAYYQGVPAGSVDVIIADDTVEIDGLHVGESFQRKGIGSRLQQYVMQTFPDKTVILVADGEDTPKEMYRKQHYNYLGFQYEVQKIFPV
ncbi:GNAT family N-acetyltransferase [Lentibacillus sp. L22]|uniref:GNAT family N-acetyltransferase n=1 Tax=Lentibacillus TaxID=175304 RepID=UPI0022B19297|nr:GNAT family N-acetyltransferase [Lentibacillus daqui]